MTDMPDDIMIAAQMSVGDGSHSKQARVMLTARAISAERERCALIAENAIRDAEEDEQLGDDEWTCRNAGNRRAMVIARAIRRGR